MIEYPKTQNLFARDPETHESGPRQGFRMPEVALIKDWLVLDKLDGMNMRVIFRPHPGDFEDEFPVVQVFGRTDRAQIPGDLSASIAAWATAQHLAACFGQKRVAEEDHIHPSGYITTYPDSVCLYGEGIGPGIQGAAGQAYGGEKRFVLFDVLIDGKWLDWDDVVLVAKFLGIEHAQVLARRVDLDRAMVAAIQQPDIIADRRPFIEGGILRTDPYVFDWRGNRVGAKYKVRDL